MPDELGWILQDLAQKRELTLGLLQLKLTSQREALFFHALTQVLVKFGVKMLFFLKKKKKKPPCLW